jgi:hypothetical protein
MTADLGKMPEDYIDRPVTPLEELKVRDLTPEHGQGFIGVGDVAVDTERGCWVLLDAPVFEADFQDVAPILIRRTPDAEYQIRMDGLPADSNFKPLPAPDVSTWISVKVV